MNMYDKPLNIIIQHNDSKSTDLLAKNKSGL